MPSTRCAVMVMTEQVREATVSLLDRGLTHIRNVVRSTLVTYRGEAADYSLRAVDIDDLRLLVEPEALRKRVRFDWVNDVDIRFLSLAKA